MYQKIIRPLLFLVDPEKVHHFSFRFLKIFINSPLLGEFIKSTFCVEDKKLERNLFGLTFKNPVGLAAGFDKNALLFNELGNLGFGFVEIGTVTPKPQPGNPKKRLFRLQKDQGIINRMGFNNDGLEVISERLKKNNHKILIGGNIGKNTATAPENYTEDYKICFEGLHPYVDYFSLNISCPNVGSHAKLSNKDYLFELITEIKKLNESKGVQKPILLKIGSDMNHQQLDDIIELIATTNIDGVIATNTSVSREGLKTSKKEIEAIGNGGLSGKPIKDKSTATIQYLSEKSNKAFPIIGVGGIHSAEDAMEKLRAGADLIQIYTGFVYEGPALIKKINKKILAEMN
jgi:dihydroorotate dehydrogenase